MTHALDATDIPYMLTGAFAGAYYGVVRSTQDTDIVISPSPPQLAGLVSELQKLNFNIDTASAIQAVLEQSMFSVLDSQTGWKTDFIVVKSRPFSQGEFLRRTAFQFRGSRMFIASAEDVVLSRLESVKQDASLCLLQDAAIILEKRWTSLDHPYLSHWIAQLDLEPQWQTALRESGIQAV